MGSTELQVFIALGVVLAAVLIALIVDFLKGSNERLRERNAALTAQERAAREKAAEMERLYHQLIELVETIKEAEQQRPVAAPQPMATAMNLKEIIPAAEPVIGGSPRLPDPGLVVETPIPMPEAPVPVRVVRDEAELAQPEEAIEETPPAADSVPLPGEWGQARNRKTRRYIGTLKAEQWTSEQEPLFSAPAPPVEAPDWGAMLAFPALVEPEEGRAAGMGREEEAIAAVEASSKVVEMPLSVVHGSFEGVALAIPGGVQHPQTLNELLGSKDIFQGVALSISVVDHLRLVAEHGKHAVEEVMQGLEELVLSTGSAADLVCRISDDEFIVICPGAAGAAATQRVQKLSESLWDFQLRSLVSFPIMFSWGACESGLMPGMPRTLADAVDRAREQMLESRRSRRALTWASAKYGLQSGAG